MFLLNLHECVFLSTKKSGQSTTQATHVTNRTNAIKKVIITRPHAQATPFAQRVAACGRQAVIFPLLDIHPLDDTALLRATLAGLEDYALVAFVSPNAIDAAFAHIAKWPAAVKISVMGEGSRMALAAHGLTDANATIYSPNNAERTDSETLLEALDLDALRSSGRKILIIRGDSGRELLADRLREQGFEVTQVAAYSRSAPLWTPALRQQLLALLDEKNDWIVTSSEALRVLVKMVAQLDNPGSVAKMQQQRLIVPHTRIAETAKKEGFLNVLLTGSGDERLLAALQFTA
jgi:uroporphyrinogen-III synthase